MAQVVRSTFIEDRKDFGKLLDIHGYRHGVEIGVDWGRFAETMLEGSKYLHLYCVDPWVPYKEIPHDRTEAEQHARKILAKYDDRVTILKTPSVDASSILPPPIDFVYVDGAHDYESVIQDLKVWWERVRVGGMLCGHDFDYEPVQAAIFNFFRGDHLIYVIPDVYDGTEGKHCSWYVYKTVQTPIFKNPTSRQHNNWTSTTSPIKPIKYRQRKITNGTRP